jgi:hypothetical protein
LAPLSGFSQVGNLGQICTTEKVHGAKLLEQMSRDKSSFGLSGNFMSMVGLSLRSHSKIDQAFLFEQSATADAMNLGARYQQCMLPFLKQMILADQNNAGLSKEERHESAYRKHDNQKLIFENEYRRVDELVATSCRIQFSELKRTSKEVVVSGRIPTILTAQPQEREVEKCLEKVLLGTDLGKRYLETSIMMGAYAYLGAPLFGGILEPEALDAMASSWVEKTKEQRQRENSPKDSGGLSSMPLMLH